jgi:MYXO-CTERM domain-containing protein
MAPPTEVVVIFHSPHRAACAERAVVLRAMGIAHAVRRHGSAWVLLVPEPLAGRARAELEAYVRENRDWPKKRVSLPFRGSGFDGVVGYVVILGLVAALQRTTMLGVEWFDLGKMQTGLVRQGEWWRTFTALTLHLDGLHLIGNIILGAVFGLLVGQLLGNGLAWFSILIAGAAGNALNALVQRPEHTAAGASTAVFAALGLLAAYVWRRRRDLEGRWALRWAPIVGGVVLLGFTGAGGERTDIIAHLTGFLAGLALGWWYGRVGPGLVLRRNQWVLGIGAVALLAGAWALAVT